MAQRYDRDEADHRWTDQVDVDRDVGVEAARRRFGGLDVPASLVGMLAALAMLLILSGIASAAIGTIAYQTGIEGNEEELSVGALIAAGVVVFVAFLVGGWAAGRMARYSGVLNGAMVAVWFLVLMALLAGLGALAGAEYNLFGDLRVAQAQLPNWFSDDTVTAGAIISAIAFVLLMFVGGIVGGLWGQRMHRRADAVVASMREGGLARPPTVREVR
jgi:hypothetical protein